MRAAVVRECDIEEFLMEDAKIGLVDLIVLSDGVFDEVAIDRELRGESHQFAAITALSEREHCAVLAACTTTVEGKRYRSCVVADCGELIDVIDMVHCLDGKYDTGSRFRVYDLPCGKIGVLIGDDVLYPEAARLLRTEGAELMTALCDTCPLNVAISARAHAVVNGTRVLFAAREHGYMMDYDGKLLPFEGSVVTVECALMQDDILLRHRRGDCFGSRVEKY